MKVKAVFFDAGGTLFDVRGSVGEQYHRFAKKRGVEVSPDILNQRFKEVFKKSPPLAFPGAKGEALQELERRWWYALVRRVFDGVPFPDFDLFFDEIFAFFAGAEGWALFPETVETLAGLQKIGLP